MNPTPSATQNMFAITPPNKGQNKAKRTRGHNSRLHVYHTSRQRIVSQNHAIRTPSLLFRIYRGMCCGRHCFKSASTSKLFFQAGTHGYWRTPGEKAGNGMLWILKVPKCVS